MSCATVCLGRSHSQSEQSDDAVGKTLFNSRALVFTLKHSPVLWAGRIIHKSLMSTLNGIFSSTQKHPLLKMIKNVNPINVGRYMCAFSPFDIFLISFLQPVNQNFPRRHQTGSMTQTAGVLVFFFSSRLQKTQNILETQHIMRNLQLTEMCQ